MVNQRYASVKIKAAKHPVIPVSAVPIPSGRVQISPEGWSMHLHLWILWILDHLWSPLHLSRYPGYPGLSSQQRPLSWYSILGVDWELSNKYLITKPTSNDQCQITSGKPYDLYDSYDSYDTDVVRLISVWCTSPRIPVQLDDSTQATLHCSREETDTTVK